VEALGNCPVCPPLYPALQRNYASNRRYWYEEVFKFHVSRKPLTPASIDLLSLSVHFDVGAFCDPMVMKNAC